MFDSKDVNCTSFILSTKERLFFAETDTLSNSFFTIFNAGKMPFFASRTIVYFKLFVSLY